MIVLWDMVNSAIVSHIVSQAHVKVQYVLIIGE